MKFDDEIREILEHEVAYLTKSKNQLNSKFNDNYNNNLEDNLDDNLEYDLKMNMNQDIAENQEPLFQKLKDRKSSFSKPTTTRELFSKKNKSFILLTTCLCILFFLIVVTPYLYKLIIVSVGSTIHGNFNYEETIITGTTTEITPNKINEKVPIVKDDVINILLIGIEEILNASNTDVIMIASFDKKTSDVKLISLMRDLYVTIPGHANDKLNSVYGKGGISLLYDTIESNFDINIHESIIVNFDSFEQIVDTLGGIEITLTQGEADYLNRTNYISEVKYRDVTKGKQILNGNQVLGYCRIRNVSTGTENDDYGRTARHRMVLNSIFNTIKSKNIIEVTKLAFDILSEIKLTTDISKEQFNYYLETCLPLLPKVSIHEYRVPANHTFSDDKIILHGKKSSVLIPKNWHETKKNLYQFIYGEDKAIH